jgi:hypothetical protein
MEITIRIFNNYYYDLLTRIKKNNYKDFDKNSLEYIRFFNENCNEYFWKSYLKLDKNNCDEWFKKDEIKNIYIYKDITIEEISNILNNNDLFLYYLRIFFIYKIDL